MQQTKHKNTSINVLEFDPRSGKASKTSLDPHEEPATDAHDLELRRRRGAGGRRLSVMRAAERAHEAAQHVEVANQKWLDTKYECSGLELLIELLHMRHAVIQLHTLKVSWRFCVS